MPYIPCLRWKQGEYLAVHRLSATAHQEILPLIEVAEVGFDFETRKPLKSLGEHLAPFARRVREKWGKDQCLVDLRHVDATHRLPTGEDALTFVFADLRLKGATAVPVVSPQTTADVRKSVRGINARDGFGMAVRVGIEGAVATGFADSLETLTQDCDVAPEDCDLVVDLGTPSYDPLEGLVAILEDVVRDLPCLNRWRRVGLIGTSFPSTMAGLPPGTSIRKRSEWVMYRSLVKRLTQRRLRVPCFGDYCIEFPEIVRMDMRLVKPYASVRYTIPDGWLIARGMNVRDHKYGQYRQLCSLVRAAREYSGPAFSEGDMYIYRCAQGMAPTGNLTTWRWVGTNHHLELVARDVASLGVA